LEINRPKKTFPLWRFAAAIALLLLAGSTLYQTSQFQSQKSQYAELEKKYQDMERNLISLKTKESKSESIIPMESQIERIIDTIKITELKYVVQYDTIYLTDDSPRQTILVHQVDTIFLPSPQTTSTVDLAQINTLTTNNQRPTSVEFLFNLAKQNDVEKKKARGPVLILNGTAISKDENK
jgi:hypothetical protein